MARPTQRLDKFGIAAALQEIATLLDLKGGKDRFKSKAYRAGARIVGGLTDDIGKLIQQDRLTSIRGIGSGLASQIKELYLTGESSVLLKLREEFPSGIIELSGVPGLTLSKIANLHQALGINTISDLQTAAEAGKIRDLKGFGAKTEKRLLDAITSREQRGETERRLHIHHAEHAANQILDYLHTAVGPEHLSLA
ncbi:MAG: helix-hairpin-helix domain-containing protein, partial [Pyrinomonadaceae bacterium]